jgi:hypothetical protein
VLFNNLFRESRWQVDYANIAHSIHSRPTAPYYSGLQFCASCVGAILVIVQTPRAKTSFAPTKKKSRVNENRCKPSDLIQRQLPNPEA